jgi:hypothetical protein
VLAGLTADDPASGPYVKQLVFTLNTRYGISGYHSAEPWARFFLFFSPYQRRGRPPDVAARLVAAKGQGMMLARNGWTLDSTLVSVHMPSRQPSIDHQVSFFGDFQIYRKGAWAVTHPLSYGGESLYNVNQWNAHRQLFFDGGVQARDGPGIRRPATTPTSPARPAARRTSRVLRCSSDISARVDPQHALPPSVNKQSDTLIVYDRTNAENPSTPPKFSRYRSKGPDEQSAILNQLALKQWIIHMPTRSRP